MRITWNELTISPDGVDFDELLSSWRWLVDESFHPAVLSALGDLFLRHDDGRIFWLEVGWGQLTEVAQDAEEFKRLMVLPENAAEWFSPNLIGDLLESGMQLGPQQCFGYRQPPMLGGAIELSNFEPTDLTIHFGMLGQIAAQTKDLPEGTPIRAIVDDGDSGQDLQTLIGPAIFERDGKTIYNYLTPPMQEFQGQCIGRIKKAGLKATGTSQFSVLVGEQKAELRLETFFEQANDPTVFDKVVGEARKLGDRT